MRSRILSSLFLATVLAPPVVWAQNAQNAEEPQDTDAVETEGSGFVDETPTQRPTKVTLPPGQTGRESAPGEVHTVQTGDTLWDLSQRYLGSPWYWPKVWSYNPEIANPHWIYPGNSVRFFPAGEEVPSRVESGIGPTPEADTPSTDEPVNGESLVEVSGPLSYKPGAARMVTTQGFVTAREVEEAGRIEGATTGAEMLSFPDVTYVRFKRKTDAKLGGRYVAFHTVQEINHPVTGKRIGYLTEFVGTMRVVALGDSYMKAQIVDTWDAVTRGDLVGPFDEKRVESVLPRRNEKEIKGFVVTALVPYLTLTAEHHFLVLDKGSADGVLLGNTFTVTRQGDPARQGVLAAEPPNKSNTKRLSAALPTENIALCMVTEVKERTANCVLTRSIEEVPPGSPVIMRVDTAPTAQR